MNQRIPHLHPVDKAVTFLVEIQTALCGAPSVTNLMEEAVGKLRRVPGTIASWIYQRDERGKLSVVHAWEAPVSGIEPIPEAELGQLLHQRWIAAHGANHSSEDFAYPFVPEDYPCHTITPMLLAGEMIGAIAVQRRDGEIFPYEIADLGAIATVAAMTAQSLQILVLRGRLVEQEEMADVDHLRREIGRTLHDGVVQDLAYMNLKLELLVRQLESEAPNLAESAQQIQNQVNLSITSMRSTITDLRRRQHPAPGITAQLRDIALHIPEYIPREIDGDRQGLELAPEIERAVIGIVREAIQNIRKHAIASDVRVQVQLEDEELLVTVADDGIGFDSDVPVVREGHFGMEQMRELAEDMGGSLLVESVPGSGTRVRARLPLVVAQSDR
jgi:signal transduction histidine kinase